MNVPYTDIREDQLRFGDEIECGIFAVDHEEKTVKLSLRGAQILVELEEKETHVSHQSEGATWHPEFGAWMIESTPSRPYANYVVDLLRVERNMILRRRRLTAALSPNEIAPTITCFFLNGAGDFIDQPLKFSAPYSKSEYLPDYIVNPHPRFAALTCNIRERRGSKVDIQVPLYRDKFTPEYRQRRDTGDLLKLDPTILNENRQRRDTSDGLKIENGPPNAEKRAYNVLLPPNYKLETDTNIHMDAMGFGMGMCCLQVTFQARDVDESRYMYDQLAVLAPIMLAMTAATPMFKGRLAATDVRWSAISQSVDDRTPAERGLVDLSNPEELAANIKPDQVGQGIVPLAKSRYDSISTFIYHCEGDKACHRTFESYNDIPCPVDQDVKNRLMEEGLDANLAHHLAHLFTRDPLVIFEGMVELNDEISTEHFENIQSTNWQTCRWKPPPPQTPSSPHIGWRTEFRSMEVQLTDFENAAFVVFTVLITRVILAFDLGLYIPLSKVDENMARAHNMDAVRTEKFYFRKHVAPPTINDDSSTCSAKSETIDNSEGDSQPLDEAFNTNGTRCFAMPTEEMYEEMTMNEIFNGKDSYYPGLIPLIYAYLDFINTDIETFNVFDRYLQFISKRAKGELVTAATWMRKFVQEHPSYRQDSVIPPDLAYDLMMECNEIGLGARPCPDVLGNFSVERIRPEDAYGKKLPGRLTSEERSLLLRRLTNRAIVTNNNRPQTVPRGRLSLNGSSMIGYASKAAFSFVDSLNEGFRKVSSIKDLANSTNGAGQNIPIQKS